MSAWCLDVFFAVCVFEHRIYVNAKLTDFVIKMQLNENTDNWTQNFNTNHLKANQIQWLHSIYISI